MSVITPEYFYEEIMRFRGEMEKKINYSLEGIESMQRAVAALLLIANRASENQSHSIIENIDSILRATVNEFSRRVELALTSQS